MAMFYCTRCGLRLPADPAIASGHARCGRCLACVRTPLRGTDDVPFARVASPFAASGPATFEAPQCLSYVPAWPERHERAVLLDRMAERLRHVEATEEESPDGMTNCSYCGTTIARFIRKCPSCRHALWGV